MASIKSIRLGQLLLRGVYANNGSRACPPPHVGRLSMSRGHRSFSAVAGAAGELLLTLASPSEAFYLRTRVKSVTVPGSEGAMTLTNHHSPLVARLKAGEVLVRAKEGEEPQRYFMSDGFVFFKPPKDDSGCCTAEVLGVEMFPSRLLDKEQAVQVLQRVLHEGASGTDSWQKAKMLLGQDLLNNVIRAAS